MYSGSAHSEFESNLPSGEDRKVRYVKPFTEPEAVKLIEVLVLCSYNATTGFKITRQS